MIDKQPILITGCPRSGSSMIAAAINICGAFGGEMTKRSMYSNDKIKRNINQYYLNYFNSDLDGQNPLPDPDELNKYIKYQNKLSNVLLDKYTEETMIKEGYIGGKWMYKDSRTCLIWPIWNEAYPKAKWVIVRRRTGDIIQSCLKTAYMSKFSNQEGWLGMVHEYEKRFIEMINAGLDCKIIWPERMIDGDYRQMHELLDWLELPWKDEVIGLIDILLWKSRQKEKGGI